MQKCKPAYGLCKGAKVGRQRLNRLQKVGPVSLELTIADTLFSRDFMNCTSFVAGVSTFFFAVFIVGCGDSGRMSKENITAFNDAHDMASLFESPKSQFNLGLFYENGLGVEKTKRVRPPGICWRPSKVFPRPSTTWPAFSIGEMVC